MGLFDALNFEVFNAKDMAKNAFKNPDQMLLGAADPFSAKVWGTVTGRDYKPLVNQFGGPSDGAYDRAEDAGIKTGTAKTGHAIAQTIASIYGGGAAMGAMGGGGGAASSGITASPGFVGGTTATNGAGLMSSAPVAGSAASSGGLMAQGNQYLQGANNAMRSASMAQQLAGGGQQQQAPSAGLGNAPQRALLSESGMTANQRRLRGLLG